MENVTNLPKTLFLSRSLPPALTGSSIIAANLARQFTRDELVLFGLYEPGRPKIDWTRNLPRLVYSLPYSAQWRGERWLKWLQFPWILIHALLVLLVFKCRIIVAVYPSDVFIFVGYILSIITGKPLFVYFHNTYLDNHPHSHLAKWLQPKVFRHAKHVFVMSKGMEDFYAERYPSIPCSALVHSFNESLPTVDAPPAFHNPLRLCIVGSINASCADAAMRIAKLIRERSDYHLTLITGTALSQLVAFGFNSDNINIKTVSRTNLMEHIAETDILLLPHGFSSQFTAEEIRTIFPTKVIEYLISTRPIIAHLPRDSFLARFLREHECALIVDIPEAELISQAIDKLKFDSELRYVLIKNAISASHQFHASIVSQHFRDVLTNTLCL